MSRRFGFAMVGVGMAAQPHARALAALSDDVAVRGVFTRTPERSAAFASQFGFAVATSIDALAGDPEVDAVLLLTPPDVRLELIERFAAAGKHILCEKPLERTVTAAEAVHRCCVRHGVELGMVFQHRFREASQRLRSMLDSGSLGRLHMVRVDVPWWRPQTYYDEPGRGTFARDGGGVLITQAIHTLDLMLSLTGPVAAVQAIATTTGLHSMEGEDFVAGGLQFENGAVGALMATTAAYPGEAETIALDCEQASVRLQSGVLRLHWHDGREEVFGATATTGGGADPMDFPFDWHRDLIGSFVDRIKADNAPLVSGDDALAVQRLIEALALSAKEGRRIELAR